MTTTNLMPVGKEEGRVMPSIINFKTNIEEITKYTK